MGEDYQRLFGHGKHLRYCLWGVEVHRTGAFPRPLLTCRMRLANTGGNACYRISKAALNQLTKTMALDLERTLPSIKVLAVHPGFVATKLTGYYGEDDMDSCMDGLAATIERFGTDGDDIPNGGYVKWTGEPMPY